MDKNRETTLLIRLREGSTEAFDQIFKCYFKPVCYFALQLTNNRQQAEDIASESLHKVWANRMNFDGMPALKAFLYKVAKNTALNYLKSLKVRTTVHEEVLYLSERQEDFILSKIVKAQLLGHIYEEVEKMPFKIKAVFKLMYQEGLSTKEVSDKLQIPEQSVRNAKTRAVNLLKGLLADRSPA
ncbi:RNA polymerase sigma factor [Parapedobacter sp. DT-150]|uniref:RNA polymerase sigma factor n=1 Tax=Parapedobacter sp. DT-150 TaxID=3396162 RepID=UPI003F1BDDDA